MGGRHQSDMREPSFFTGTVWVAGDPASRIPAQLALDRDRLSISSGDNPIGDWSREELDLSGNGPRFQISVEGEKLVIDLTEPERFAHAAGLRPPVEAPPEPEPGSVADLSQFNSLRPGNGAPSRRRKSRRRGRHLR